MSDLTLIAATFLLAGFVKGVIGLGLPTVAMGLLGLAMPPSEAAALLLVPSLVTNLRQAAAPGIWRVTRRLRWMLAGVVLGTVASAGLIAGPEGGWTTALGSALVLYAVTGLSGARARVPPGAEPLAGPLVGAATGVVTGATGVFVVPAVPYLGALGLPRDDLVTALGISFTVSTVALAAGLAWHGALPGDVATASALATLPALLGMAVGGWVRGRVSEAMFRLVFFAGLLILGGELLRRGLG